MAITLESVTPQAVLSLIFQLPPEDRRWLVEMISEWDELLPERATVDEAIELYLADRCSLARAAELAGVTQWVIRDILKERGVPIRTYSYRTAEEIDNLADQLEREGIL